MVGIQMKKTAMYNMQGGIKKEFEYDTDDPCLSCGQPVIAASVGGTAICPWCDMGVHRDGRKWTFREMLQFGENTKLNIEKRNDNANVKD